MKKYSLKVVLFAVVAGFVLYACSKSDGGGGTETPSNEQFKTDMLTNYADNVVIPAYTDLQAKLVPLETDINAFLNTPSVGTQQTLKASFKAAYLSYENISVAYFGPASASLLNVSLNAFPTAIAKIESGIQSGTYNLSQPGISDSIQGFPALDFLLFSNDAVQKFSDVNSANRKKYAQDVVARMKTLTTTVLDSWKNTYRATFIGNTKTDVGSPIGFLLNQFAYEMDQLKGPRIGWPYGKQSGGIPYIDKCEGYYSGISLSLAIENLTSLKKYFTGGSKGIDDYLVLLKKDQLNTSVLQQFDLALNKLKAIPEPLSNSFLNNKDLIDAAYREVQTLLTLIKTDVASATGVRITYQDSDGD